MILEENIVPKMDFSNDQNAKIEIKKYSPNEIILQTDSKENMILFISDNYYYLHLANLGHLTYVGYLNHVAFR